MEIIGDPEGLKREILEMARRESAAIIKSAEEEASAIMAAAEKRAEDARAELLLQARAEGERRRGMLLAGIPAEAARLQAGRLEELLADIKAEAARLLPGEAARAGSGLPAGLAAQAIAGMEGDAFVVSVSPENLAGAAGIAAEAERLAGRGPLEISIEADPAAGGGAVVRSADGRQLWDNSPAARLERVWPEMRRELGVGLGEGKAK